MYRATGGWSGQGASPDHGGMEHDILMALASVLRRELSPAAQDRVLAGLAADLGRLVELQPHLEEPVSRVLIILAYRFGFNFASRG